MKSKKIHEPKKVGGKVEGNQQLFTTFAESEMMLESVNDILKIIFSYMPSHVEIIEPEELKISNYDLNSFMNELVKRLHQYDEIAKSLIMERRVLQNQLQQAGIKPETPLVSAVSQSNKKSDKRKIKSAGTKKARKK